jgi:hypothetical protein
MISRLLLVPLVAGALVHGAEALEASASAGFAYSQTTVAPHGAPTETFPHFDLNLALDAKGYFSRRELLDWSAGASYRRINDEANGSLSNRNSVLLYNGAANLNLTGLVPVTTGVSVSRYEQRYTADAGSHVYGTAIGNNASVGVGATLPSDQSLNLGYSWSAIRDAIPGLATHDLTTHAVNGALGLGVGDLTLNANYAGVFSSGSWGSDSTDQHSASVYARTAIAKDVAIDVQDSYYLFVPRETGAGLYGREQNAFNLRAINRRSWGGTQSVQFLAQRASQDLAPGSFAEATRQSLRWSGDFRLDGGATPLVMGAIPEDDRRLYLRMTADGSFNRNRTPLAKGDSWGETGAAELNWFHSRPGWRLELRGGPRGSLAQDDAGNNSFGYGFGAGGYVARPWNGQTVSLNYNLDFGTRLYGSDTWALLQQLAGSIAGPLGHYRYQLQLRGNAQRTRSGTLGDGATRSLELQATASDRDLTVEAIGSLSDGLAAGASQPSFIADGLFIPAPYDSHARNLSLRVSYNLGGGFMLQASGRASADDGPGRPSIHQAELWGRVQYSFGGLSAAIEDRITWYDQGAGGRINYVFLSIYRRLGFRS